MSMRISSALLATVLLAGCSSEDEPQKNGPSDKVMIDCALGKGASFKRQCEYEVLGGGKQVVIRHPDGGFRRFDMLPGGAGVASVDGAGEVIQGIMAGQLEVSVGPDRYRLPTISAR